MTARWGLRGKSVATLLLACLLSLIPAALIGWQAIDEIRRHFANAYAENYTLLHRQRILAPVSRELALAQRFAGSVATREWLNDETDPERQARFFEEAEGFREDFADHSYFIVAHDSGHYYFSGTENATGTSDPQVPRYRLDPLEPDDAWYYSTVRGEATYNLNVNIDRGLGVTKVWLNVVVREGKQVLGLAGTGFELSGFLDQFIRDEAAGVTPMIVDRYGALQAHPSLDRIAFSSGAGLSNSSVEALPALLGSDHERRLLDEAMLAAHEDPEHTQTLWASIEGQERLLSIGYIPELDWYLVTALDLGVAQVLEQRWLWPLLIAMALILATLVAVFAYATDRLILAPLGRLKLSAQAIAAGQYDSTLPTSRQDEIGELSQAFSAMAGQVQRHTRELEDKVRERTKALEQANAEMAAAQQKIQDSIEYASFIQRAILPDRQLGLYLEHCHGVLWRPRDTVGGDFYLFRPQANGYLLGVVDCAGHGVPGSLMTMLARAIIDHAILQVGAEDPAAILNETDRQMRDILSADQLPASIATNMDIGLVWIDRVSGQLTFSGAKIHLYASDGQALSTLAGHKRPLGHKRPMIYTNRHAPLQFGWTYMLCTDGFLDQAGGEQGFGFGNSRFECLLLEHAQRPLTDQMVAFEEALHAYQGELPQRDDITLLGFRFPQETRLPAVLTKAEYPTRASALAGLSQEELQ